jgi:peptidoglycan/xylan/chitin deacetylase (PgdA/CDA1 family)
LHERATVCVPRAAGEQRLRIDTPHKKRRLYSLLHSAWQKQRPLSCYQTFCSANGYDHEELHWRNAIQWSMLDDYRGDPLIEIGAHTMSHPRLSQLDEKEATAEISGSRQRIQERLGVPAYHFAFPHGDSSACGAREYELARRCGFASAVTTRKGIVRPGRNMDAFALPRITLQGEQRRISAIKAHFTGLSGLAGPSGEREPALCAD